MDLKDTKQMSSSGEEGRRGAEEVGEAEQPSDGGAAAGRPGGIIG